MIQGLSRSIPCVSAAVLAIAGLMTLGLASCSKPSETAAPAAEAPLFATAPTVGPTDINSAAVDDPATTALTAELTQVVRRYAAEKQRAPKGFEEIVAAGYLPSMPAAPGGRKFVIDKNLHVSVQ